MKTKHNKKTVIGVVLFFILALGFAAVMYMMNQSQDTRSKAAEECPNGKSCVAGSECSGIGSSCTATNGKSGICRKAGNTYGICEVSCECVPEGSGGGGDGNGGGMGGAGGGAGIWGGRDGQPNFGSPPEGYTPVSVMGGDRGNLQAKLEELRARLMERMQNR